MERHKKVRAGRFLPKNKICKKAKGREDDILSLACEVHIKYCRGQSYDNVAVMSRKYSGVPAKVRAMNPFHVLLTPLIWLLQKR